MYLLLNIFTNYCAEIARESDRFTRNNRLSVCCKRYEIDNRTVNLEIGRHVFTI